MYQPLSGGGGQSSEEFGNHVTDAYKYTGISYRMHSTLRAQKTREEWLGRIIDVISAIFTLFL